MPDFVYADNRLTDVSRRIYCFIHTYKNPFYFGNAKLCSMFGCKDRAITTAISQLEELGFIRTEYVVTQGGGKRRLCNDLHSEPHGSAVLNRTLARNKDNNIKNTTYYKNNTYATEVSESQQTTETPKPTIEKETQQFYRSLIRFCQESQGLQTPFVNFGKQAHAIKSMLVAKYTEADIRDAITKMAADPYWKARTFDCMTVSNHIHRYHRKPVEAPILSEEMVNGKRVVLQMFRVNGKAVWKPYGKS